MRARPSLGEKSSERGWCCSKGYLTALHSRGVRQPRLGRARKRKFRRWFARSYHRQLRTHHGRILRKKGSYHDQEHCCRKESSLIILGAAHARPARKPIDTAFGVLCVATRLRKVPCLLSREQRRDQPFPYPNIPIGVWAKIFREQINIFLALLRDSGSLFARIVKREEGTNLHDKDLFLTLKVGKKLFCLWGVRHLVSFWWCPSGLAPKMPASAVIWHHPQTDIYRNNDQEMSSLPKTRGANFILHFSEFILRRPKN